MSLTAPLGTIYFTLDGSDPRAPGGGLSLAAQRYASPVPLTTNCGIFARARYTNAWSPPTRALYVTTVPALSLIAGGGSIELNWPNTSSGYKLYTATNLGPGAVWGPVANLSALTNSQWRVVLPLQTNQAAYYRLGL